MAQQRPRKFKAEPYEWHEVVELKIETLSNLGAGIAKPDGWVVFVPFALPGERIRAKVWRNEANCSHADLVEILDPSPDRIEPHCRHFTTCGGCQYQHLPYEKQLEWKTRQVRELLLHMVGIEEEVNPTIPSPKQWGYRSKITPHFQRPKPGEDFPIGFLEFNRRTRLVDVYNCPIAMDEINEALQPIRDDVKRRAAEYKKGATLLLRATEDRVETDHRAPVSEKVGDLKFNFLAGDFFQNNPFILDSFTGHAAEQAKGPNQKYLLDAYCGSGLFGLTLAKNFEQVVGIELSETSADWARRNAKTNGIENASFIASSAEALFADITFPSEQTSVLIDPPRKGCSMDFLNQLFTFGPSRVVYVSCNPATQMRDLKSFLEQGYKIESIQPFDLFPQTRHLECVIALSR
ncbi:class I SAM-dependent RNA methyltransferase [Akkermansiaceae bacterium]|jgi:tRNA/tmRNA/rRNA uracil-C5-methylase (TrmA/RlmC/RlmD family)|nr:class I SAM-dependent RNA methyltransferase [Verrucomicrobiota bacterium]MBT6399778.1 class I SAM-dependent RNA methyltransferase [Verrucomicrobiota bacterium]MDA7531191.1 class I SAM-dependent RNA methyltransferase [Akkermansiaceae bacterium]MDC0270770.1 class I SAM-dependent RNA methyltransferase [Akkermansiaceae bacterium]MDC0306913.1 class I SAM-dependent RNA methyltransferase [Akkermansiaceae bacterium]